MIPESGTDGSETSTGWRATRNPGMGGGAVPEAEGAAVFDKAGGASEAGAAGKRGCGAGASSGGRSTRRRLGLSPRSGKNHGFEFMGGRTNDLTLTVPPAFGLGLRERRRSRFQLDGWCLRSRIGRLSNHGRLVTTETAAASGDWELSGSRAGLQEPFPRILSFSLLERFQSLLFLEFFQGQLRGLRLALFLGNHEIGDCLRNFRQLGLECEPTGRL